MVTFFELVVALFIHALMMGYLFDKLWKMQKARLDRLETLVEQISK